MSFCRKEPGVCDLYLYESLEGRFACQWCLLDVEDFEGDAAVTLAHLSRHVQAGHLVPSGLFVIFRDKAEAAAPKAKEKATTREPTKAELTFLYLLYLSDDFTRVGRAGGDLGVQAAFACILEGWIECGHLTAKGAAVVEANRTAIEAQTGKPFADPKRRPPVDVQIADTARGPRVFYLPERMPEHGGEE